MDITNIAYQSELLGRLGAEFQGLSYTLAEFDRRLRAPIVTQTYPQAIELHNIAGTCARLRSQTEHVLKVLEATMYRAEELSRPKGEDS